MESHEQTMNDMRGPELNDSLALVACMMKTMEKHDNIQQQPSCAWYIRIAELENYTELNIKELKQNLKFLFII